MELKLLTSFAYSKYFFVLIVPYGIETDKPLLLWGLRSVLIVPYGIETRKRQGCGTHASVLIVPYGIETKVNTNSYFIPGMC